MSYGCNGVFDHNYFLVDVAYCTGSRGNVRGKREHEWCTLFACNSNLFIMVICVYR